MTELGQTDGSRAAAHARIVRHWAALMLSSTLAACKGDPLIVRGPRIEVTSADRDAVWFRTLGAPLAVQCTAVGGGEPRTPVAARTSTGVVSGTACGALTVVRSGVDTLVLRAEGVERRFPIAVALPPQLGSDRADRLTIDGLPPDPVAWWAPSARLNSRGEVELYAAAYRSLYPDTAPHGYLYRLVQATSGDPLHFRFDGIALEPDANRCSLMGSGIENVAIVPRAEGAGSRMFLAAGSFECYGWQVFSAASPDERLWSLEPGIRVANGPIPPDSLWAVPASSPWPVGEGMVVRRVPSTGEWQMIVGGTVPEDGRNANDFEIVEWRSPDQVRWHYHGAVFTLADLQRPHGRTLYSPTVREFAPALYRMVFAEDGSYDLATGTRLYTAVSVGNPDGEHWQFEGTLLDDPAIRVFYASVVGDRLYTLSAPQGAADVEYYLSAFTLRMP
jgi:hypothetical protein